MPNISTVRDVLFEEFQAFPPGSALSEADERRIGMKCQVADRLIDLTRLEVQLAAVMKGALEVPFIESQTQERRDPERQSLPAPDVADAEPLSPMEQTARLLARGPKPDHFWKRPFKKQRE